MNQLIILTEQKREKNQQHVIIIKQNKVFIVHSMFPKKEREKKTNKQKPIQFATFCLERTTKNRETGIERVR